MIKFMRLIWLWIKKFIRILIFIVLYNSNLFLFPKVQGVFLVLTISCWEDKICAHFDFFLSKSSPTPWVFPSNYWPQLQKSRHESQKRSGTGPDKEWTFTLYLRLFTRGGEWNLKFCNWSFQITFSNYVLAVWSNNCFFWM